MLRRVKEDNAKALRARNNVVVGKNVAAGLDEEAAATADVFARVSRRPASDNKINTTPRSRSTAAGSRLLPESRPQVGVQNCAFLRAHNTTLMTGVETIPP